VLVRRCGRGRGRVNVRAVLRKAVLREVHRERAQGKLDALALERLVAAGIERGAAARYARA